MAGLCEKRIVPRTGSKARPRRKAKGLFTPTEACLTEEEAVREARRCLSAQTCDSCELCSLLCPDLCITKDEEKGFMKIDLDYCKGCAICAAVCPKGAIKMVLEE